MAKVLSGWSSCRLPCQCSLTLVYLGVYSALLPLPKFSAMQRASTADSSPYLLGCANVGGLEGMEAPHTAGRSIPSIQSMLRRALQDTQSTRTTTQIYSCRSAAKHLLMGLDTMEKAVRHRVAPQLWLGGLWRV